MKLFILIIMVLLSKNVEGQKPYYKRIEYEITYKRTGYNQYSRFNRKKNHTEYRIFNRQNQLIELGEYGLKYCKSFNNKKSDTGAGIIIHLYRVEDFNKLKRITYYNYNARGIMIYQESHDFFMYPEIDTTKTFFSYNDKNELIQEKSISKDGVTDKYYSYDNKDSLIEILDDRGRSYIDKNTIKRYDTSGKLIEEIFTKNGTQESRVEYINDILYNAILGFNAENKLESIQETYGLKDKPEKEFSKNLNNSTAQISEYRYHTINFDFKYHVLWMPKKIIRFNFDLNSFKKKRFFITKYKYKHI